MITHIDLPLALWLVAPGMRYHYAGGQSGPYGDTLDAIRIESVSPNGETLLAERPSEGALILAALDHCDDYPGIIDWENLPQALSVSAESEQIGVNQAVTIGVEGRQGLLSVVLRMGGAIISQSVIEVNGFEIVGQVAGMYTIHVFDRAALAHGSVTLEVTSS